MKKISRRFFYILSIIFVISGMLLIIPGSLYAAEKYPGKFVVIDEDTNSAISGANITIGSLTGTTDSAGEASFTLPKGNNYTINAIGYDDKSGKVNAKENWVETVKMKPVKLTGILVVTYDNGLQTSTPSRDGGAGDPGLHFDVYRNGGTILTAVITFSDGSTAEWNGKNGAEKNNLTDSTKSAYWHWRYNASDFLVLSSSEYTDTVSGSITVTKNVIGGLTGTFNFDVKDSNGNTVGSTSITINTGETSKSADPITGLAPRNYTVIETTTGAFTTVSVPDDGVVTVVAGQNASITFTNDPGTPPPPTTPTAPTAPNYVQQTVGAGTNTVDASSVAGAYATITGSGGQTVTIEKISSAAASAGGFYIEGATTYVDLHLDTSEGIEQIQFTILGGAGVPRWWNGSSWIECSDYTIDAAGNVTTTITNSTTPSLSDLTGTVFTVFVKPAITVLGITELEQAEERGPSGPAINEKPLSDYDKTNSGFATLFYNRLLRRAPEQEGLDAWIARLTSGALTGADLVNQFIFGKECQKTISGYTNNEFITFLYKALFNRAPEEYGFNAWLDRMAAGMTKEEVVNGFTHSLEFEPICKNFGIKPYPNYTGTGK